MFWPTVLGIATLLGGASALVFFYDRWRPAVRPRHDPLVPTPEPAEHMTTLSAGPDEPAEQSIAFPAEESSVLFSWRMNRVFPGVRGLTLYEGEAAIDRLEELLHKPLVGLNTLGNLQKPFWWFRGGSSSSIEAFRRLALSACLLNDMELEVKRIAAWREHDQRREFVYVEVEAMEPTGLYPDRVIPEDAEYAFEEYAILHDHLLTLSEFDDGYARIDGKVVRIRDAERRCRYLKPYNFIICGKSSPLNSSEFDRRSRPILNGILVGAADPMDLVDASHDLPFHYMNDEIW
jgi:hypothetical protein